MKTLRYPSKLAQAKGHPILELLARRLFHHNFYPVAVPLAQGYTAFGSCAWLQGRSK